MGRRRNNWSVKVAKEADADVRALDKSVLEAVVYTMNRLACEDDPRSPHNQNLNVCPIIYDAPGWFRVRVFQHNYRVVFTLTHENDCGEREEIEISADIENCRKKAILITDVAHRGNSYGRELRNRYSDMENINW